jgi:NAD(P)-dependent dehydrogenase (short-subunit alcohol dehydrogenase family)
MSSSATVVVTGGAVVVGAAVVEAVSWTVVVVDESSVSADELQAARTIAITPSVINILDFIPNHAPLIDQ